MERRFAALVLLLAVSLAGASACSRSSRTDPLGSSSGSGTGSGGGGGGGVVAPTNTPTPSTHVVLAAGVVNTWMGLTQNIEVNPGDTLGVGPGTAMNVTVLCDGGLGGPCNIFTRTPSIRITNCTSGMGICTTYPTIPTGFLINARINFDLQVNVPLNEVNAVWVYWGNLACYRSFMIPKAQLTFGSFNSFSIPVSAFSPPALHCSKPNNTPIQVTLFRTSPGSTNAGFAIDNVVWTSN